MKSAPYLTNARLTSAIANPDRTDLWQCCQLLAERLSRTYRRDREDLVQAATLKAYAVAAAGKIKADKNPFSYLSRVVMNALNAVVNAEKRHQHVRLELPDEDQDE